MDRVWWCLMSDQFKASFKALEPVCQAFITYPFYFFNGGYKLWKKRHITQISTFLNNFSNSCAKIEHFMAR